MKFNGVFEGGGLRAIAFVGALSCLEKHGHIWENAAGTSAGSLIASLVCSGYTSKELKDLLINVNFLKFIDSDTLIKKTMVTKAISFFKDKGIYSGDYLEEWIDKLLKEKGITTFGDLKSKNGCILKIIASDITKKKMMILPDDLPEYGIDPDSFPIAKAVRMSCSIPFYFKPVELNHKDGVSFIVDGSLCCNYPITIFDNMNTANPTLGFKFKISKVSYTALGKTDPLSLLFDMADTIRSQNIEDDWVKEANLKRSILIPIDDVDSKEFDITKEKSLTLYRSGYRSAQEFLETKNS